MSFTALLSAEQTDTTLIQRSEINPLIEDKGRYRLFPYFPIEEGRRFEIYQIEIDPGGRLGADPHPAGTQEFILVSRGTLEIIVGDQKYSVAEGAALRFRADRSHVYHNTGSSMVKMQMVIHYPD